ncbi:hypothetical protein [Bacillus cereus]|uniref:hypothetical protein n=1 Tax=Bacillus cereus TaxID=1396 RepID=UPI001C3F38BC|nr:hypothetical protein [Bacillus cereus]
MGIVNSRSIVVASICEAQWNGSDWVAYQGNANAVIQNVIPKDDGTVQVRGYIYWGSDVDCQISLIIL